MDALCRQAGRWLLPALVALALPQPASAQRALVEEMRALRTTVRSAEVLEELGRAAEPRAPHWFAPDSAVHASFWWLAPSDRPPLVVRNPIGYVAPPPPPPPPAPLAEIEWKRVPPRLRERWVQRHIERVWLPEGLWSERAPLVVTPIDTMRTPVLRARLNNLFGPPTRNVLQAERDGFEAGAFGQFEYWFAVNDTIPVHVVDRNGPFGRGLVFAGARQHRAWLPQIKRDLARRLVANEHTAPYVDYYHDRATDRWWRTGLRGDTLFTEPTRRPRRR